MANGKPLLTIDKFSGSGLNGILFCEGFYPEIDNGKSVMSEGFQTSSLFTTSTSGFSNLGSVYGSIPLSTINNSEVTYNLYIDGGVFQRIFANAVIYSNVVKPGQIHLSSTTDYCAYPDIIETTLGNILFPSERYIGRGVRGKVTGGSTTTLIDTTRNFGTLGYANGDKVTNLKTGIEYTITSITTTTNTNDTLNFTASGSNTNTANDEFIAWQDDRFDTNLTKGAWQLNQTQWVKQFRQYGDQYLFTNGNYLGIISADESTVDATYKQLPAKHQALCMGVNNEQILVSANFNGKGVILLWDGATDGWNNILKFDVPITSLTTYNSGYVFVAQGNVYFTDGYQIQKLYGLNSTRVLASNTLSAASHNALVINQEILYCANINTDLNFIEKGVYALDLSNVNNGFTLIKQVNTSRVNGSPYSLALNNRFSQFQSLEVGGGGFVNFISQGAGNAQYRDKSFILIASLPEPRKITGVGLNLSRYLKSYSDDINTPKTRSVQVSIGDGNRGLISYAQTTATGLNANTLTVNGTLYTNNEVGDEIFLKDDSYYGERTFITEITGKGTSAELWSISPSLTVPSPAQSDTFKTIRVKKLDRKTVNYNDLNKEFLFINSGGILSNKIFIEVVFYGQESALPLNINEIKIYGD